MESIGPYRVDTELGRGAMGIVFRCFDPAIGRAVAIKVIRASQFATVSERAELKLRFAREATAAGRLSHPNIVTVHQLSEQADLQYLVLELVEGWSLEKALSDGTPLDRNRSISILSQVADALDYAHGEGVVHRDVKPANILIRPDGKVKITDFGIARISCQTVTRTGFTMGTPAYMAPEQIMSARVNGRADQFSLAAIAYQMLSGRRPFVAETDPGLILKIVSEEAQPLHELDHSFPPHASDVLRKGMAKDPDQRFATCAEFVKNLADSLDKRTAAAPPVPVPAPILVSVPEFASPASVNAKTWAYRWAISVGAAAFVILALSVGTKVFRRQEQHPGLPRTSEEGRVQAEHPARPAAEDPVSPAAAPSAVDSRSARKTDTPTVALPPSAKGTEAAAAPLPPQASPKPAARTNTHTASQPSVSSPKTPERQEGMPPQRIPVDGSLQAANLINQVKPVYPPIAKQAGISGTVELRAVIGTDGHVADLKVISGHPLLREAAVNAVKEWVYRPTLLGGKPVAITTTIDVNFTLTLDSSRGASPPVMDSSPGVRVRPPVDLMHMKVLGSTCAGILSVGNGRVVFVPDPQAPTTCAEYQFDDPATEVSWYPATIMVTTTCINLRTPSKGNITFYASNSSPGALADDVKPFLNHNGISACMIFFLQSKGPRTSFDQAPCAPAK